MNHPKPAENPERDAELDKLRHEIEMLTRGGIIEVAVRNPSVAEYMSHWESRATAAEGRVALLEEERDEMTVAANDYAHQAAKAMLRERELSETLAAFVQRFEVYAGPNDMHAGKHDLELLTLGRARLAKGGQS